jgi:hypothetical protein
VRSLCAGFPLASKAPITPALPRLNAMFDPLRNDLRFQKMVAKSDMNGGGYL